MSIRFLSRAIVILLLSPSCASGVRGDVKTTSTHSVVTSTLQITITSVPAGTSLPPLSQPTPAPANGITSTQVNVRAEPSTASTILGVIPADMSVEITGRDPGGNWWQINYAHPQAIGGKGWVTAQYVVLPSVREVPIIGGTETDPGHGPVAIVQQQINVRSGPGTDFNSLGTLNPQDLIHLSGKDPNGAWLQIEFAAGPEGKGWVNAAFVQVQGAENIPIIAESGLILGTGTPTGIPATPTPTLVPAWPDGDSSGSPVESVTFGPNGTQMLIYNGDLSVPQGDREDWIAFRSYIPFVFASLECDGSDSINIEIIENTSALDTYIKCNEQMKRVVVDPNANYLVHLQAVSSTEMLQYTNYILTIKTRP